VWCRLGSGEEKLEAGVGSQTEQIEPLKRAYVVVTPFSLQQLEEKLIRIRCLNISRA